MQPQYSNTTACAVAKTLKVGSSSELEDLFKPLKKLGLNAFFYSRFQGLSRINCLSNHAPWLEYLKNHIQTYQQNFETQFHFRPGFSVDLMNIFPKKGMILEMAKHNLNNGIYLSTVSRDRKTSEIFLFTTSEKPEDSNQKLLEQMALFYQFINYFKENAGQIIKDTQLTKNEITSFKYSANQMPIKTSNATISNRYYLGAPYDDIYLNQLEFNYLKEFVLGKSIIEIANSYSVSKQTIEKQIKSLIKKLNCSSSHELLEKIIFSPLFYPIFLENHEIIKSSQLVSNHPYPMQEQDINLTQRQKDCIYYLTKGMTIKQIAKELKLAPKTIEHYINHVKIKLNCKTRTELIIKANQIIA